MALKERIQADLKAALLSGSHFETQVLRGLKAAVLNEEVAGGKRDEGLSDDEIEKVIAREVKKRLESAKLYDENGRPELAETENKEIEVLKVYLPEQMSEEEARVIVDTKVAKLGATDVKMMGQVIGAVKSHVGNKLDGATIARLVKEKLTQ